MPTSWIICFCKLSMEIEAYNAFKMHLDLDLRKIANILFWASNIFTFQLRTFHAGGTDCG
jgi:hypothetical protein